MNYLIELKTENISLTGLCLFALKLLSKSVILALFILFFVWLQCYSSTQIHLIKILEMQSVVN